MSLTSRPTPVQPIQDNTPRGNNKKQLQKQLKHLGIVFFFFSSRKVTAPKSPKVRRGPYPYGGVKFSIFVSFSTFLINRVS